jgi:beta-lactamase superfamily II metal-dependent hydrolase
VTLEVAFLDVGNADCIVLRLSNNRAVIVDVPKTRNLQQWLLQWDIHHIESIYITHGHQDHLYSPSQLITFLANWFEYPHRTIGKLYLPSDIYETMFSNNIPTGEPAKHNQGIHERLKSDLERLRLWRKAKCVDIFRSEQSGHPHIYADLSIHVLHPSAFFATDVRAGHRGRLNDIALVLRIDYGSFRVLLPSDIEGEGMRDLLEQCTNEELHCHILKIPHHGAWQRDTVSTESFFMRADPELAILSVGSKNTYKHVRPGLFRSLIQLQQTHRLQKFICTSLTRTCKHTAQERAEMKDKGLSSHQPCAGTIVIEAEQSGEWLVRDEEAHEARVETIERAACCGRADLADDDIAKISAE